MNRIHTEINFTYSGGTVRKTFSIRGTNLPWTYENKTTWIRTERGADYLDISVEPTFNYPTKKDNITVTDRFGNEILIHVVQTGFTALKVECPTQIVLHEKYYENHEFFNTYITVYGGTKQEPSSYKIKKYIKQVWDNSAAYNDFVLAIPKTLEGEFKISHAELKEFKKWCKENDVDFNLYDLTKTINIVQVSMDDSIGSMVIEINGHRYSSGQDIQVEISSENEIEIKIISTKYTHVVSNTSFKEIDDRKVDVKKAARWVKYTNEPGIVKLKASEFNKFGDRECVVQLANYSNPLQYININVIQPSNT